MRKSERCLFELMHLVDVRAQGMTINYTGHNPPIIDNIPHKWSVQVGRTDREHYVGFGITMDDAILDCYEKWQNS